MQLRNLNKFNSLQLMQKTLLSKASNNIKITFVSSSHRQDEIIRKKLDAHLSGLKDQSLSIKWYKYPSHTTQSLDSNSFNDSNNLHNDDVVALLVSPESLNIVQSTPSLYTEIRKILQLNQKEEIVFVPILIRQIYGWQAVLGNLAPLPSNGIAVDEKSWVSKGDAYVDIVKGIEEIIERLKEYRQKLQDYKNRVYTIFQHNYPPNPQTLDLLNNLKRARF